TGNGAARNSACAARKPLSLSNAGLWSRAKVTCGENLRGSGISPTRTNACSTLSRRAKSSARCSTPTHRLRGLSPPPKTPVPASCNVKRRARKRANASSISLATASPVSPMKRKVRWKLPGSTRFAPRIPERSNDSCSLSSGGKSIPTKRRNIASRTICPFASSSGEEGEDAGMTIKPVAGDLGLHPGFAEQRRAARDAADIDPGLWWSAQTAGKLPHHAVHVAPRALGIAPTEQDRIARGDLRAQYQPAAAGVDCHQIANEVVAGVRTGDRQ